MLCLFVFLSLSIQISTAHGSRGCCGSTRRLAKLNVNPRRWTTWTSKMSCLDPNHSARVRFQTCGNSACGLAVMDCGSGGLQTGWVTMVQPGNWDLSGLKACPRTSSHYLHSNCHSKLLIAGYMAPGLTTQSVKSILFGKDMAETRANLCEVLQTVKKLVNAHGYHYDPTRLHQLKSACELDAILAAAGKHQNSNVTDPRQCALQFVDVAEELIHKRLTDKYDSFVVSADAASASSAKPGAKAKQMIPRTFDENGQLPWPVVLKELGYEVSSHVERKKDKTAACIEDIIDDKVILAVDDSVMAGGKCQVSASSFTAGEWKVVKEPKVPELAKVILPKDWTELRHLYAKGALVKQMLDMEKKDDVSSVPSKLLLYQKPQLALCRLANLFCVQFSSVVESNTVDLFRNMHDCLFMY